MRPPRKKICLISNKEKTMSTKTLGTILLVVGLVIVAAVLLATPLGIVHSGFGAKHIIGVVIGVVVFIVGIFLSFMRKPN